MRVELRAGEPFARIALDWQNPVVDHRLRFHVPLARPATASHAEGQFAVVDRPLTMEGGHGERPLPTFPAHGWVAAGGAAILTDHVMEYELVDGSGRDAEPDGAHELALTVLRATGTISRTLHPWRDRTGRTGHRHPGGRTARPVQRRLRDPALHRRLGRPPRSTTRPRRTALPFVVAEGSGAPELGAGRRRGPPGHRRRRPPDRAPAARRAHRGPDPQPPPGPDGRHDPGRLRGRPRGRPARAVRDRISSSTTPAGSTSSSARGPSGPSSSTEPAP